jgi:hypothetical protein
MKMVFKNCVTLIFIKGVTKDGVETCATEPPIIAGYGEKEKPGKEIEKERTVR